MHGKPAVRPRQHALDVVLDELVAGSEQREDLAPKMLLDQGKDAAAMDGEPMVRHIGEGTVRAHAPVGGDQVWVGVVREIRVEGLQDRHDAGLEAVRAEGLLEEVGEYLGGKATQLAEQGGIMAEERASPLGDGDVPRLAANIPLIRNNLAPLSFVDIPVQSYVDAVLGVYELTRLELLRDLFVWAYERSCQRYTVLRDALPAPDPLRLRYRTALAEMVRETVQRGYLIEARHLRELGRGIVDPDDLDAVVAMAIHELHRLHDGNIARFGLRLGELRAWSPDAPGE